MADEPKQRQAGATHGPDGTFIRTVEQARLDAEAAQLRSRSMSYRAIATQMGVDVHTAHRMVERALAEVVRESGEAVVANELAKLDALEAAAIKILETAHLVVSNGKIMRQRSGPLLDDGPALSAIAELRRLSESRRKLVGADAATKMETSATVRYTYEGVDVDGV